MMASAPVRAGAVDRLDLVVAANVAVSRVVVAMGS
jgi:hypothetical protein